MQTYNSLCFPFKNQTHSFTSGTKHLCMQQNSLFISAQQLFNILRQELRNKTYLLEGIGEICSLSSLPSGQSDVLLQKNNLKNATLASISSSSDITPPYNLSWMTDLMCLTCPWLRRLLPIHSQMLHPVGLIAFYSRQWTLKFWLFCETTCDCNTAARTWIV